MEVKSATEAAEKHARVCAQRSADYADGIERPRRDWEAATLAAEDNYGAGVQAAIAEGRFGRGVSNAGTETWKKGAREKGVVRWAPGVSLAKAKYQAKIAGVLNALSGIALPARGPKGDPRNIERVAVIARELHERKGTF